MISLLPVFWLLTRLIDWDVFQLWRWFVVSQQIRPLND